MGKVYEIMRDLSGRTPGGEMAAKAIEGTDPIQQAHL